jgi:hypothetical protein
MRSVQDPLTVASNKRCKVSSPQSINAKTTLHGFDLHRERIAVPVSVCLATPENNGNMVMDHRKERFAIGDEVECCDADGWWSHGIVTALRRGDEPIFSPWQDDTIASPQYHVRIMNDSSLIWASDGNIRVRRSRETDLQALPERVEDAVAQQIELCDPQRTLHSDDFFSVLTELTETVTRVMDEESRQDFDVKDRAFITHSVRSMLRAGPGASEAMILASPFGGCHSESAEYTHRNCKMHVTDLRRLDHVVFRLQGQREWASGIVQRIEKRSAGDQVQIDNESQGRLLRVYVTLDAPNGLSTTTSRTTTSKSNQNQTVVRVRVLEDTCHLQRTATMY